jgi:hypothetical protein
VKFDVEQVNVTTSKQSTSIEQQVSSGKPYLLIAMHLLIAAVEYSDDKARRFANCGI